VVGFEERFGPLEQLPVGARAGVVGAEGIVGRPAALEERFDPATKRTMRGRCRRPFAPGLNEGRSVPFDSMPMSISRLSRGIPRASKICPKVLMSK
jgi:hypothetical protein